MMKFTKTILLAVFAPFLLMPHLAHAGENIVYDHEKIDFLVRTKASQLLVLKSWVDLMNELADKLMVLTKTLDGGADVLPSTRLDQAVQVAEEIRLLALKTTDQRLFDFANSIHSRVIKLKRASEEVSTPLIFYVDEVGAYANAYRDLANAHLALSNWIQGKSKKIESLIAASNEADILNGIGLRRQLRDMKSDNFDLYVALGKRAAALSKAREIEITEKEIQKFTKDLQKTRADSAKADQDADARFRAADQVESAK